MSLVDTMEWEYYLYEIRAIIQRGLIEHGKIIYISSNRRMKQLMDWLSNTHWTLDTGRLTYLLLSNGTQAKGDPYCPVQRCFEEFTSHQLDLSRPTVHANLALKSERSARVTPGHLSSGAYYLESSKPTHLLYFQPLLFSCCDPSGVAARASYSVTLLLPGKECERDKKCQKPNMSPPASPNHSTQNKNARGWITK